VLLQSVMLDPSLARRLVFPRIDEPGPEAAALDAVLDHCTSATVEPTTASLVQHFADSSHARTLAAALASATDHALTAEQAEIQAVAAAERLRRAADRQALDVLLQQPLEALTAADRDALAERLKAGAGGERLGPQVK
jgi:hypothetical protein